MATLFDRTGVWDLSCSTFLRLRFTTLLCTRYSTVRSCSPTCTYMGDLLAVAWLLGRKWNVGRWGHNPLHRWQYRKVGGSANRWKALIHENKNMSLFMHMHKNKREMWSTAYVQSILSRNWTETCGTFAASSTVDICWYPKAQIANTGMGQRITSTGTSSGTGCPILDKSLVPTCLTLLTLF